MPRDRRRTPDRRQQTGPQITPGFERRDGERRRVDFGAPKPSAWSHLLDLIFFRSIGVAILAHETVVTKESEWAVIMAGVMMFFMPDALRGKNSLGARIVRRKLQDWADSE